MNTNATIAQNAADPASPTGDAATATADASGAAAAAGEAAMSFVTSTAATIKGIDWMNIMNLVMS